jgi:arylsulfatase A-like enzyme
MTSKPQSRRAYRFVVARLAVVVLMAFLALQGLAGSQRAQGATSHSKPNVVYIMLDEWAYFEMSCMGNKLLQTPVIDRMAAEGLRFTQCLAGGNVCASTRASLMMGQHTGHCSRRYNSPKGTIRADEITIAQVLKQAGYATGGFGKWGLGHRGTTGVPELHGFDEFYGYYHQVHAHCYYPNFLIHNGEKVPLEGNSGEHYEGAQYSHYLIFEKSKEFIRQNKDRPFFAYLCWTLPHGTFTLPEDDPSWPLFKDKPWPQPKPQPSGPKAYAAMMHMADRHIGEILELLKELDLEDDTIVFLCGDNGGQSRFKDKDHPDGFFSPNRNPKTGELFRGSKGNFYEGGLRIPMIVRWPGKVDAGAVSDHLCYFPDIMPTLAELAGLDRPSQTDGISLVPLLLGEDTVGRGQEEHKALFWESKGSMAVRLGHWKAIKPKAKADFELYDLSNDLQELNNVADQHPEIMAGVRQVVEICYTPERPGQVLDETVGFKNHKAK